MAEEKTLYEGHPAMFRNAPITFVWRVVMTPIAAGVAAAVWGRCRGESAELMQMGLLLAVLAVALYAAIAMLRWWVACLGTNLTVTDQRIIVRRGLLSKATNEVRHKDIRNIQVYQSVLQRLFGVGSIGIASAGHSGIEISVCGLRDPQRIADLVRAGQQDQPPAGRSP